MSDTIDSFSNGHVGNRSREDVEALLADTRRRFGPWTAHDIPILPGVSTGGSERSDDRLGIVLRAIEDFSHKPVEELRILDLGALEGLFAVELARLGADVVAVEARDANVARCHAAVQALGLERHVTVLQDDVRNVDAAIHGRFDVVLCLGILYHLDAPDVFRFVSALGELCDGLLVVDTHVALTDDDLARLGNDAALTVDPLTWLSGTRVAHDDRGYPHRGRIFFEHARTSTEAERLESPWASLQKQSFWLERDALLALLSEAGFNSVYSPASAGCADRIWLVGTRNDQRTATALSGRLRRLLRPTSRPDPPLPDLVGAPAGPPDVVCFGIIPWNGRWQRPQQILSRLARRGHRVFLITADGAPPPGSDLTIDAVAERVWEARPAVSPPFLNEQPVSSRQVSEMLAWLEELATSYDIGEDTIALVQIPSWTAIATAARASFGWTVAYDCMDEWDGFEGVRPWIAEAERTLIREADTVVASALPLWDRTAPIAGNAALVRNGGDPQHYAAPGDARPLQALDRPIIGFVGGLASWVDVELVARAACERPEWTFVLVGDKSTDLEQLRGLDNVHLLGRQPYALMPAYVRDFDVCLVPFRVDHITHAVDPVKIYEYFSLGKPVVSRPMPELRRFGDLVHVAIEPDDFVEAIERALAETDPALAERRRAIAAEADWDHRVDTMLAAIERGRTTGYDRVRTWILGQHLHAASVVAVVGEPQDRADVIRLRPELFVGEDAAPAAADAVLALSLEPPVLARARELGTRYGHQSLCVLTSARGSEVPSGHRDLHDAACAALMQQDLAALEVVRLMWDAPEQHEHAGLQATRMARVDAHTRELLLRVAPATAPATVQALQEQLGHARRIIDAQLDDA